MPEQDHFTSFREVGAGVAAGVLGNHPGLHRLGKWKGSRCKALYQTIRHKYYVYCLWDRIRQRKLNRANGIRAVALWGLACWVRGIACWERDANLLPVQRMSTLAVKKNDLKVGGVTHRAETDQ